MIDIRAIMESLRKKRPVFHSEADFQFALAWEIQLQYPTAAVRIEYPPENDPAKYIDILVLLDGYIYPIELKYKTKKMDTVLQGESFHLKNHGAQDLGNYDFIKDIYRIESFSKHIKGFKEGYVIWLTNDPYYWKAPRFEGAGYIQFSVHEGAVKEGEMSWGKSVGKGTTYGREKSISLIHKYVVHWNDYFEIKTINGRFMYAFNVVPLVNH